MSDKLKDRYERTPLNSEGDFYVIEGTCLSCMAPESVAPELMSYDRGTGCYFKRQPATPEEVEHAVEAVWVSCVEALHYSGDDPKILERLRARSCKSQCDALYPRHEI
jgi:hypothetical protein